MASLVSSFLDAAWIATLTEPFADYFVGERSTSDTINVSSWLSKLRSWLSMNVVLRLYNTSGRNPHHSNGPAQSIHKQWPNVIGGLVLSHIANITLHDSVSVTVVGQRLFIKADGRFWYASQLAVDLAIVVQKWGSCRPQKKKKKKKKKEEEEEEEEEEEREILKRYFKTKQNKRQEKKRKNKQKRKKVSKKKEEEESNHNKTTTVPRLFTSSHHQDLLPRSTWCYHRLGVMMDIGLFLPLAVLLLRCEGSRLPKIMPYPEKSFDYLTKNGIINLTWHFCRCHIA